MRYQYTINKKTCHFHYNNNEPLHEVNDIMGLLNIDPDSKNQLIKDWSSCLVFMPDGDPTQRYSPANFFRCIPEKHLPNFLHQAQKKQKGLSALRAESLINRILNARLDAIAGNHTEHFSHTNFAVREGIARFSKVMYRSAHGAMEAYEKAGIIGTAQITSWHRIKTLLPTRIEAITERHLFALLSMIAPLWPTQANPVFLSRLGIETHEGICKIISMLNNNTITEDEKSIAFFEALKNIGNTHNNKQGSTYTPSEP
ncbi:hypothetical protein [Pseudomonas sp. PDM11]|uniref:hypothetical protein n=1 Tax=Pseudomonas sp. PDM11 TaxID=2769309 RepID=UPI00177B9060|nr:hypothetical protein [Pseudomonas sp. PDM11]MBD9399109.1 hypothetical protein [Pseudomonas sp. PDM11]